MAYRLLGVDPLGDDIIKAGVSITDRVLSCYDTIGDPSFDMDRDFILHTRSALEFARVRLLPKQQADLDEIDAYWRAHPKEFNEDFKIIQGWEDRKTALEGFVEDEQGKVPAIPRSHWWWWPIPIEGEKGAS